jgi:hypothetical protein
MENFEQKDSEASDQLVDALLAEAEKEESETLDSGFGSSEAHASAAAAFVAGLKTDLTSVVDKQKLLLVTRLQRLSDYQQRDKPEVRQLIHARMHKIFGSMSGPILTGGTNPTQAA